MATKKYLDKAGLEYFYGKLKTKFQNTLTPGKGIKIDDNTISCTLDVSLYKIVESLPLEDQDVNKIYLVKSVPAGTDQDMYTEYLWTGSAWEKFGTYKATIDLEPYAKTEDVTKAIEDAKSKISDQISGVSSVATANKDDISKIKNALGDDLEKVKAGAEKGATAVQHDDLTPYAKTSEVDEKLALKLNVSDLEAISTEDIDAMFA